MKITIDLPAKRIEKLCRLTERKKESSAVSAALNEFVRQQERRNKTIEHALSGKTNYRRSNEETTAV
ncbi:MAG: hypothetical protein H0X66_08070 [Verrucomicrobia bacterium]|nr:hypothetical protein [Verrucomicrobiota bacterium]